MDRSVQIERHFFVPRGDLTMPKLTWSIRPHSAGARRRQGRASIR